MDRAASSSTTSTHFGANDIFLIHFGSGTLNRVEMVTVLSGDCLVSNAQSDDQSSPVTMSYKMYCDETSGIVRLGGFSGDSCGQYSDGANPIGASSNVIVDVADWNKELYNAGSYGSNNRRIELYCSLNSVTSHYNKLSWTNHQDAPVLLEYHPNNYCGSVLDQGFAVRQYISQDWCVHFGPSGDTVDPPTGAVSLPMYANILVTSTPGVYYPMPQPQSVSPLTSTTPGATTTTTTKDGDIKTMPSSSSPASSSLEVRLDVYSNALCEADPDDDIYGETDDGINMGHPSRRRTMLRLPSKADVARISAYIASSANRVASSDSNTDLTSVARRTANSYTGLEASLETALPFTCMRRPYYMLSGVFPANHYAVHYVSMFEDSASSGLPFMNSYYPDRDGANSGSGHSSSEGGFVRNNFGLIASLLIAFIVASLVHRRWKQRRQSNQMYGYEMRLSGTNLSGDSDGNAAKRSNDAIDDESISAAHSQHKLISI